MLKEKMPTSTLRNRGAILESVASLVWNDKMPEYRMLQQHLDVVKSGVGLAVATSTLAALGGESMDRVRKDKKRQLLSSVLGHCEACQQAIAALEQSQADPVISSKPPEAKTTGDTGGSDGNGNGGDAPDGMGAGMEKEASAASAAAASATATGTGTGDFVGYDIVLFEVDGLLPNSDSQNAPCLHCGGS